MTDALFSTPFNIWAACTPYIDYESCGQAMVRCVGDTMVPLCSDDIQLKNTHNCIDIMVSTYGKAHSFIPIPLSSNNLDF